MSHIHFFGDFMYLMYIGVYLFLNENFEGESVDVIFLFVTLSVN
jgi:hypothetical protein